MQDVYKENTRQGSNFLKTLRKGDSWSYWKYQKNTNNHWIQNVRARQDKELLFQKDVLHKSKVIQNTDENPTKKENQYDKQQNSKKSCVLVNSLMKTGKEKRTVKSRKYGKYRNWVQDKKK